MIYFCKIIFFSIFPQLFGTIHVFCLKLRQFKNLNIDLRKKPLIYDVAFDE
jgi:hypothetical protein